MTGRGAAPYGTQPSASRRPSSRPSRTTDRRTGPAPAGYADAGPLCVAAAGAAISPHLSLGVSPSAVQVGVEEPATFRAVVTTASARGLTGIFVIRPGTSTAGVPGLTELRAVGTEWQGVTSGHLTSATALRPATTRSRRAFGLRCHRSRGPRQCLAGRDAGVRAHDSDRRQGRPRELSCCDRTVPAHGRTPSKPRRARTNVGGGTARPQSTCWRHDRLTIGEGVSATLFARYLLASGHKGRRSETMDAFPRDTRNPSSR